MDRIYQVEMIPATADPNPAPGVGEKLMTNIDIYDILFKSI